MRDLTIDETLISKAAFERMMHNKGHKVQGYRGDNGRFGDKGFRDSCDVMAQELTFCAVGGHHQHGVLMLKDRKSISTPPCVLMLKDRKSVV